MQQKKQTTNEDLGAGVSDQLLNWVKQDEWYRKRIAGML
jgi:hypothetical protein